MGPEAATAGTGSGFIALMRVSMSRVRDVEVRGGVVEGQVELGAGGAEGHVAGVEMVEPGPGLVGSVDCRAFANLLKILRRARVEMRMMMMTIVVVTALGR